MSAPYRVIEGDALTALPTLQERSVHCAMTSPPYFGLRDYKVRPTAWPAARYRPMPGLPEVEVPAMECALGLEPTPEAYVAHLVLIYREVRRVLRDDATCWVNLGDSYAAGKPLKESHLVDGRGRIPRNPAASALRAPGAKPKDLVGIPWRFAFAMQADGWYLRMDNIWAKDSPMPESVRDRTTRAHEYVFHFAKSAAYFYDAEAVKETASGNAHARGHGVNPKANGAGMGVKQNPSWSAAVTQTVSNRNKRSVWRIPPATYDGDHYATYPVGLPEIAVLAGTSARGCCPSCGAPWVRQVEKTATGRVRQRSTGGLGVEHRRETHGLAPVGGTFQEGVVYRTVGWAPSCSCPAAEPVPCTVLDPFSGRATTGVAALRNGRAYVGIELSPKDAAASLERLAHVDPLLRVEPQPAPEPEPHPELALSAPPCAGVQDEGGGTPPTTMRDR